MSPNSRTEDNLLQMVRRTNKVINGFFFEVLYPYMLYSFIRDVYLEGNSAFYLSYLYQEERQPELYQALFNLYTKDPLYLNATYTNLPIERKTLLFEFNTSSLGTLIQYGPLDFEKYADLPFYHNHSYLQGLTTSVLSGIQWVRGTSNFEWLRELGMIYNLAGYQHLLSSLVILGPINEELVFRGLLQKGILQKIPEAILPETLFKHLKPFIVTASVMIQAMIFAGVHNQFQTGDFDRFLSGLLFGYAYEKHQSLLYPCLLHMFSNLLFVPAIMSSIEIESSMLDLDTLDPSGYVDDKWELIMTYMRLAAYLYLLHTMLSLYTNPDKLEKILEKTVNFLSAPIQNTSKYLSRFSFFSHRKQSAMPVIEELLDDDSNDDEIDAVFN